VGDVLQPRVDTSFIPAAWRQARQNSGRAPRGPFSFIGGDLAAK
jgi:hypothetical protein